MTRQDMIDRLAAVKKDLDFLSDVFPQSGSVNLTQASLVEVHHALVRIAFHNEIVRETLIHDA